MFIKKTVFSIPAGEGGYWKLFCWRALELEFVHGLFAFPCCEIARLSWNMQFQKLALNQKGQ